MKNKISLNLHIYTKATLIFSVAVIFFYYLVFNYRNSSFSGTALGWSLCFGGIVIQIFFFNPLHFVALFSSSTQNLENLKPFLRNRTPFDFLPLLLSKSEKRKILTKLVGGFYKYGSHELYLDGVQSFKGGILSEFQFKSFEALGSGHLYLLSRKNFTLPLYLMYRPEDSKQPLKIGWKQINGSRWLYQAPGSWLRFFGLCRLNQKRVEKVIATLEKDLPQFKFGVSVTSIGYDRLVLTQTPLLIEFVENIQSFDFEQ